MSSFLFHSLWAVGLVSLQYTFCFGCIFIIVIIIIFVGWWTIFCMGVKKTSRAYLFLFSLFAITITRCLALALSLYLCFDPGFYFTFLSFGVFGISNILRQGCGDRGIGENIMIERESKKILPRKVWARNSETQDGEVSTLVYCMRWATFC